MFHNVTTHHTPAYDFAPNPDKQWILRHTERMLPIHRSFTDMLMTKRLQTLQSVDSAVEQIVQRLSDTGQLANTYIFYTSDHGYHLGQFGLVKGKAFPFLSTLTLTSPSLLEVLALPPGLSGTSLSSTLTLLLPFWILQGCTNLLTWMGRVCCQHSENLRRG